MAFSPAIDANPDVYCGGQPVELNAFVSDPEAGDFTVVWGPEEFLSDTLGETVYASGMVNPEYFNVHVVQEFDAFGGLLCEADADILVGTRNHHPQRDQPLSARVGRTTCSAFLASRRTRTWSLSSSTGGATWCTKATISARVRSGMRRPTAPPRGVLLQADHPCGRRSPCGHEHCRQRRGVLPRGREACGVEGTVQIVD